MFFLPLLYRLKLEQVGPAYLHHGTQRGVQSMGPIFIPRDLNIEHREIHWKPLIVFGQIMCGSSSEMEKLRRLALTVIFFVIPAYAGIQCQSGPRIKSGVTV